MSEGDIRPWGDGEPPHGYVCRFCGRTFSAPSGCSVDKYGTHQRSMAATARWHRTIEEIAAVSEENARREQSRGQFVVKIDLDDELFAGGYKDRDLEISAVLRSIADRMTRGQYSADGRNNLSARSTWNHIGFFKFKERT